MMFADIDVSECEAPISLIESRSDCVLIAFDGMHLTMSNAQLSAIKRHATRLQQRRADHKRRSSMAEAKAETSDD